MTPVRLLTMVRRLLLVLPVALSLVSHDMRAQTCAPAKTALVLSGGGAKGFAHIGVLEIIDSLGLKPESVDRQQKFWVEAGLVQTPAPLSALVDTTVLADARHSMGLR